MFTVCPKCALTLLVTAADLRVAQGYVRCGRCSSVFNALARLTDERQQTGATEAAAAAPEGAPEAAKAAAPREPASPTAETAVGAVEAEVIPEAALEFDPDRIDVTALFVEPEPDPHWTAATGSFKAMIAAGQEAAADEPAQEAQPPAAQPPPSPQETAGEVEVDAAFLAQMLSGAAREPPPAAVPTAAGSPPAPEVPPAETWRRSRTHARRSRRHPPAPRWQRQTRRPQTGAPPPRAPGEPATLTRCSCPRDAARAPPRR